MATHRGSRWHFVLYPVAVLALADIAYQLLLSWKQADLLLRADPLLISLAILNQLVAYQVVVPAMQRFYSRVGIRLSGWRTFGLVSLGLAVAKVIPAGEYLVWRLNFRRLRGGATATTQWLILYYIAMFSGLVVLFLMFEVATLVFYPHAPVASLAGKLRYLPIAVSLIFVIGLLATRIPWVAQFLKRVAYDKLGSQAVSPIKIIRERKLDRDDLSALAFASLATWLVEALTLYLCMTAMGLHVPFVIAIFGFAFARLFSLLPLVPAGIGEIEAGTVLFFAAYGYPVGPVFTATVMFRLITYWPPILIGLASYIGIKKSGGSAAMRLAAPQLAAELHKRQGFLH